jgi:outer membrane protein assembly factor BamB
MVSEPVREGKGPSSALRWGLVPRGLGCAGLLLVTATGATGADWPQWRGAARDGRAVGVDLPASWPAAINRVWHTPVGLGDATPALVDGRLHVFGREGEQEVVRCLQAKDGREVWRHAYAAVPVTGPAEKYAGPRSSPAVAAGRVITLGVGGVVSCLAADDGRVIWRHEALVRPVPRFFTAMSPLVVDGLAIVHLGGRGEGLLAALDLADGRTRWTWAGDGPAYASPVEATLGGERQVVVQTEKGLAGIAIEDGRWRWGFETPPKPGYWNSVTPVVQGDLVLSTGQGTGLRALQVRRADGGAWTVEERWHNPDLGTVYATPIWKDGIIHGLNPRGQFFAGEAATGATRWLQTARVSNFGSLVEAGPVLFALVEKTGLLVLASGAETYTELARYPVSAGPVYAHPVVAGRRVFIRDRDSVAAWEW